MKIKVSFTYGVLLLSILLRLPITPLRAWSGLLRSANRDLLRDFKVAVHVCNNENKSHAEKQISVILQSVLRDDQV